MANPAVAAIPPVVFRVAANGFDPFAVIEEENLWFLIVVYRMGEPF